MKLLVSLIFCSLLMAGNLYALPFSDDMVDNQLTPGQIARPQPKDSISKGSLDFRVRTKEEATALVNPTEATPASIIRGHRLFEVNCSACHGVIGKVHQPAVAGQLMGAPNLADPLYHDRTPGGIFSTIHFGNVIMPAVGWKLSTEETWDVINYVRNVQKEAAGEDLK